MPKKNTNFEPTINTPTIQERELYIREIEARKKERTLTRPLEYYGEILNAENGTVINPIIPGPRGGGHWTIVEFLAERGVIQKSSSGEWAISGHFYKNRNVEWCNTPEWNEAQFILNWWQDKKEKKHYAEIMNHPDAYESHKEKIKFFFGRCKYSIQAQR